MLKCIIGADLVPTDSNIDLFASADADVVTLIGKDIKKLLDSASFTIFNLEVPLTDLSTPIKKMWPESYCTY